MTSTAYGQFPEASPDNPVDFGRAEPIYDALQTFEHHEFTQRSYGLIDAGKTSDINPDFVNKPRVDAEIVKIEEGKITVRPRGEDETMTFVIDDDVKVTLNQLPVEFEELEEGDVARIVRENEESLTAERIDIGRAVSAAPSRVLSTSDGEYEQESAVEENQLAEEDQAVEQAPDEQVTDEFEDDQSLEGAMGVVVSDSPNQGILVLAVRPDSPAENNGLQTGDYLLELDGVKITAPEDFLRLVKAHEPGETVQITLWRRGTPITGTMKLTSQIQAKDANSAEGVALMIPDTFYDHRNLSTGRGENDQQ